MRQRGPDLSRAVIRWRSGVRERCGGFLRRHAFGRLVEEHSGDRPPDRTIHICADDRLGFPGQRRHARDDSCGLVFRRSFIRACRAWEPGASAPWRLKHSAPFHDAAAEGAVGRRLWTFCGSCRATTTAPDGGPSAAFPRSLSAASIEPHHRFIASIFSANRSRLS
jgi:hypothetical protein